MSNMTQIELDAISYYFKEFNDTWDIERILDAYIEKDERVKLWVMFEPLDPHDLTSAVNDLMHLLRRTRKQAGIL